VGRRLGAKIVNLDVIIIGGAPAGVVAALRAADLAAKTGLIIRDVFGGMAANDGPVPVRTLAHAARLMRETRQLGLYGITVGEPSWTILAYSPVHAKSLAMLAPIRLFSHKSILRGQRSRAGAARFTDPHTPSKPRAACDSRLRKTSCVPAA
jgi:dihydrolipoamide dehydrogenase